MKLSYRTVAPGLQVLALVVFSPTAVAQGVLVRAMERRSVQSAATCEPQYGWMDNSIQQPPCIVAAFLFGQCNEGTWTVTNNTSPNSHYNTPNATTANQCACSWAAYNALQACAFCQAGFSSSVSTWTQWSTNCTTFLSAPNPWPKGTVIPEETAIPFWATTDPNTWPDAKFDASTAQSLANENKPDTTNASLNDTSSSSHGTPVGAIAGGVVGGVLLIALLALGLFYLSCRRRAARASRARGVSVMSLTTDAQHAHGRSPSGGTTGSGNTGNTTLFGFGAGFAPAGNKYGLINRDHEFTSPLMSGTPESGGGVSLSVMSGSPAQQQQQYMTYAGGPAGGAPVRPAYQQAPSSGGSTSTSMLMAPGTTPSPAPSGAGAVAFLPPGIGMGRVGMSIAPMGMGMAVANPNASGNVSMSTGMGPGAGYAIPQSPPNPSMNSVSFAAAATARGHGGHEHTGSSASGASTGAAFSGHGHGHAFSVAGSGESELPEGAISPFILPVEDSSAGAAGQMATPDESFASAASNNNSNNGSPFGSANSSPNNPNKGGASSYFSPGAGMGMGAGTPLRKPHEPRARINPPAYSPTASPEESMFASARQQQHQQQHQRSALSFSAAAAHETFASDEATGAESSVGLSGTTLGSGSASGGPAATLLDTARSPSPVEEDEEREDGRHHDHDHERERVRDANGFPVDRKI